MVNDMSSWRASAGGATATNTRAKPNLHNSEICAEQAQAKDTQPSGRYLKVCCRLKQSRHVLSHGVSLRDRLKTPPLFLNVRRVGWIGSSWLNPSRPIADSNFSFGPRWKTGCPTIIRRVSCVSSSSSSTCPRERKRKETLVYYDDLVRYVDGVAKGGENIILLAAMDVTAPPGPAQPMSKVQNNRVMAGEFEQSLLGYWDSEAGARYYDVQITSNPSDPANWTDYVVQ